MFLDMFGDLIKRLTAPAPEILPDEDARRALAALLVRVAKADGQYDAAEISHIDQVLATRYALNPIDAAKLRAEAEEIERDAPDTVRFTRAIKDAVPLDEREAVVGALWQVVLADGVRETHEDQLMRMVAPMLGLSDQDSNRIRRAVEAAKE